MPDDLFRLHAILYDRVVGRRGKVVEPIENRRERDIGLGDAPRYDRDAGPFHPLEADGDHECVENSPAGWPDIIACQFVRKDGVIGLGLVRVVLRDDMSGIIAPDDRE